jgi:hypothetical protein
MSVIGSIAAAREISRSVGKGITSSISSLK